MSQSALIEACAARRQQVLAKLPENSIAILFANPEVYRNHDANYPYRQTSDFLYLSGVVEQDAVMVLSKSDKESESVLFSDKKDPKIEQWIGPRIGADAAVKEYAFDKAFELEKLDETISKLMEDKTSVYVSFDEFPKQSERLFKWLAAVNKQIRKGINTPSSFQDLRLLVHEMRLIKSDYEIECLRDVCELSAEAHINAMRATQADKYEYEIESVLLNHFMKNGARFPAYECIVAGGANACVLHYTKNTEKLKSGELLLIDAGGEKNYYAADITRTFPIDGKFTEPQKEIYELVLKSQMAAIEIVKPGVKWHEMQDLILKILTEGLVELGILSGNVSKLIEDKKYMPYYMHNSGHWLGLDVHDRGRYKVNKKPRTLEKGMVFTIEPGLYLSPDDTTVPEKYRGIGVRIEDDILVTADGYDVLTATVPKTVSEIEKICHENA